MGSSLNDSVSIAESKIRSAESKIQAAKNAMEQAKKNGNYKNSHKCYSCGGKTGNVYDNNLYIARQSLKEAKADLAEAKKKTKRK